MSASQSQSHIEYGIIVVKGWRTEYVPGRVLQELNFVVPVRVGPRLEAITARDNRASRCVCNLQYGQQPCCYRVRWTTKLDQIIFYDGDRRRQVTFSEPQKGA